MDFEKERQNKFQPPFSRKEAVKYERRHEMWKRVKTAFRRWSRNEFQMLEAAQERDRWPRAVLVVGVDIKTKKVCYQIDDLLVEGL